MWVKFSVQNLPEVPVAWCWFLGMSTEKKVIGMNSNRIQELLKAHLAHLKKEFHVEQIGLFGSVVRGEETSQSDIDILVVFQRGHKDFFNYMRLKAFLEDRIGREVDLVLKEAVKSDLVERIFGEVEYVP